MEKKAKHGELLAEESFLMTRQIAENEAEGLKVQEMVEKAKERAKVFEKSSSGDGKLCPQTEEAKPDKQTDIDHYLQRDVIRRKDWMSIFLLKGLILLRHYAA